MKTWAFRQSKCRSPVAGGEQAPLESPMDDVTEGHRTTADLFEQISSHTIPRKNSSILKKKKKGLHGYMKKHPFESRPKR